MSVPAFTLTDANTHDTAPLSIQSPTREISPSELNARFASARPDSPTSRPSRARAESGSAWPSPGRIIRTISPGITQTATNGSRQDTNGASEIPATIDPLSQHILNRTYHNSSPLGGPNGSARPRTSDGASTTKDDTIPTEQDTALALQQTISRAETTNETNAARDLKKGVKAVAFLTRLMGAAKRTTLDDEPRDDDSSQSEDRPEGNDATVFTQPPLDNVGYSPATPQPPAYIKVRSKYKKDRDFDRLFLAQELVGTARPKLLQRESTNKLRRKSPSGAGNGATDGQSTIWAMQFSKDGKYLAAAGADQIVRIWAVLTSPEDRRKHETQENEESGVSGQDGSTAQHLSAPVFLRRPVREFEGHTATVLDLSWSKNNFLLSSSMDKTVKLWHISRAECLCTFKHSDFVPSIAFHPKDDRFFLAGSLDSRLRLWSIPDKSVAFSTQVPDMITAVAFTPDGKSAIAGCLSGLCMFYETENFKYQTQIHVRSTRGQNAKGSKITGIQTQYGSSGDVKVLITSNDSRVRLYNFRDKSLELKLRGGENNSSQIRASVSDDGRYVVCGSEDCKAYIWSMRGFQGEKRDKIPIEMFEAHNTITTTVCMAPMKTRYHLSMSEDPVYDMCNPPPVMLLSQAERESQTSSRAPTENGSIQHTPTEAEHKIKGEHSSSYLSRCGHKGGAIIVTADYTGTIKVFRQDCGWAKRRPDDWDRSSIFTKRSSRLGRHGSLATRSSQRSLREGRASTSTQAPSERINSWRNSVVSNSPTAPADASARSRSPRKSLDRRSRADTKLSSSPTATRHPLAEQPIQPTPSPQPDTQDPFEHRPEPRPDQQGGPVTQREHSPLSTHPSTTNGHTSNHDDHSTHEEESQHPTPLEPTTSNPSHDHSTPPPGPPVQSNNHSSEDLLAIDSGGRSNMFWEPAQWEERKRHFNTIHAAREKEEAEKRRAAKRQAQAEAGGAGRSGGDDDGQDHSHLAVRPPLNSAPTYVSELSDEHSEGEDGYFSEARESPMRNGSGAGGLGGSGVGGAGEEDMKCDGCGSLSFAGKRVGSGLRLVCVKCGKHA